MGDRIQYEVRITHNKGVEVQEQWPLETLGEFEILDSSPTVRETLSDEKNLVSKAYLLTAFATGELSIPPFEVTYSDANGAEERITSPPVSIAVTSLIGSATPQMRDIKPPMSIPFQMTAWLYWVLGAIAVLIIVILAAVFWKRPKQELEAPAEPIIPADVWALGELRKLRLGPLLRDKASKQLSIAVSEIIRTYMERRYGMNAMDMTTEEIMTALEETEIAKEIDAEFGEFFSITDLIKFAKYLPPDGSLIDILDQAEKIVQETKSAKTLAESQGEEGRARE